MKNTLIFLLTLLSLTTLSQDTTSFPQFYIENEDTLGIILSIEQAQQIDNDAELLELLQQKGINCDSTIKAYIKVVNEYDNQIAILELKIKSQQVIIEQKDEQIKNLNSRLENCETDVLAANRQIEILQETIKNLEKRMTLAKIKSGLKLGGGVVVGGILGFILGVVILH